MELDHVIVAVQAPREGLPRLPGARDLVPHVGGRHLGWGTANWIVPLGDAYLELVAVVDQRAAGDSHFGRWVSRAPDGAAVGWAVRPDDLDATAARSDSR